MATELHHTIVVCTWDEEALKAAHAEATALSLRPSPISTGAANGFDSFFIPPDGHGQIYDRSVDMDGQRATFRGYLRARLGLQWFEAAFSRDTGGARITHDGCKGAPVETAWKG